jgi:protein Mpv17
VFELELELCQVHSRSQGSSAVRQSELERVHHRGRALALRGGAVQMSLGGISAGYATALAARPVLTKSLTSGAIFALSDVAGQSIAPSPQGLDLQRTVTNLLVGLCCFGPALHYWLELITGLIPGVGVVPTLLKTLMGQTIFGPTITGVFFAAALVSNHGLVAGLKRWPLKVKQDLLKTWTTGLCFWPFVDLACYGLVLPYLGAKWISLSYNMASFFWTIFLSLQAARQVGDDS